MGTIEKILKVLFDSVTPPNFVGKAFFSNFSGLLCSTVTTLLLQTYKCHTYLKSFFISTSLGLLREQHMSHKKNQFWVIQARHRVFDKLLWLVTYFTETQISQTYQPSHCFKMVHFEGF